MTNILKKTTIYVTVIAGALAYSSVASAQSTSNGKGGNQNSRGPSPGYGIGPDKDVGEAGSKGDNNFVLGLKKAKRPGIKNPNNNPRNPRIPRIPKEPEEVVALKSQNSPCGVIYNQITRQNMLVMVPRYNDCIRRGLEN